MGKREDIHIPEEELLKQREFIRLIKELNNNSLKKYSIRTYGCQMNENDSERLSGMLSEMGYQEEEEPANCDLIIYNTCCVRENAELKVYGHLGQLKKLKEKNPDIVIAVCGCMMQQQHVVDHIKSKYRHVGLIFGTHNLYRFPELLYNAGNSRKVLAAITSSHGTISEGMPIKRADRVKAWVTIMYGCNNFCSYCIVPYVRGRERSRDAENIKNEAIMLGLENYREITLLGQNVNSYGKDLSPQMSFASLLGEINSVSGIERIRFMTSHPKDLSDDLIYAMRDFEKVCEHLHLPLQSGSTGILNKMNRKYTKEHYLDLVNRIRDNVPGISLTTDIIVGFPGETTEDFEETIDVLNKVRFDTAYTFLYSRRTGTPAAENPDQVDEETKKKRFDRLLEVQNRVSREINDGLLEMEVEVLVEGTSRNNPEKLTGRTRTNKIVNFDGPMYLMGRLVMVKIKKIQTWSLEGELVK